MMAAVHTALAVVAIAGGVLPVVSLLAYPLVIVGLAQLRGRSVGTSGTMLSGRSDVPVVVMMAAHNEEATIERAIDAITQQLTAIDRCIVVSDASSDSTDDKVDRIASLNEKVIFERQGRRAGKNAALNAALMRTGDLIGPTRDAVVLFTDANAVLQPGSIEIVREWFAAHTGCLVGELVFVKSTSPTAWAEGLYWRFENMYKDAESTLGLLCFGNGALLAARVADIGSIPSDCPNDFWTPVTIRLAGGFVSFDRRAVALEEPPKDAADERARKGRMANRQMATIVRLWAQLPTFLRIHLLVRKVFRWYAGVMLVVAGISLVLLGLLGGSHVATVIGGLVVLSAALGALRWPRRMRQVESPGTSLRRWLALNHHFWGVQFAAAGGATAAILGRRASTWQPSVSARLR